MDFKNYDFSGIYRLVDVQDHNGNSKADTNELYSNRIGCITKNIHVKQYLIFDDIFVLQMNFTQDPNGKWINRCLQTSDLVDITTENEQTIVKTANSIYIFEPASFSNIEYLDEADVIELYLNHEVTQFCRGFYYDHKKMHHELTYEIRHNLLSTVCLIRQLDCPPNIHCRYYIGDRIVFCSPYQNRRFFTRNYLIHNVSDKPLDIRFEEHAEFWTIEPGEKQYIYRKE